MAISSSPEAVRDMEHTIQKTIKDIRTIQQSIQSAAHATANWNDAQGQQYQALMRQIAQLTQAPMQTLSAAVPKLESLARSLDAYGKVKF